MPNSANRSKNNNNSSKGHAEDINNQSDAAKSKPNPERSDLKHGDHPHGDHHGDTSRSSNQGRKEASGGSAED